ncbi:putative Transmembrane amino acid transporter protein putativeputative [Trypanosoma vivax]|uniref:Putative amino acid transporter n=1 Tax=Trypanosoma vivax (strain Y486) TaxID=1055687 RepID=G0U154_TRYVY|nr:putative Transmembrane amino acid transporter protein putativeputative [Trypanosoma vivax]CCC49809.1 putative amino acid transporter [Trypanosoma vivax Y486]
MPPETTEPMAVQTESTESAAGTVAEAEFSGQNTPSTFAKPATGLCSSISYCVNWVLPHGGALSTTFNLGSATLGAGVISLAAAFNMSGVLFSVLLLVVVTALTIYSVALMMQAVALTGYTSYATLSRNLLGRGWDHLTVAITWLFTFGTCVSYVIAIGHLLEPVLSDPRTPEWLHGRAANRMITSAIWFLGMFPLSLPKEINSLRYASTIGVFCVCFFVICIVVHSLQNGFKGGKLRDDVAMFKTGNSAIEGLSIFMFAYLCHMNCFSIYAEMRKPSVRRMTLHTGYSMTMCCIVYIVAGFFGYADFGSKVTETVFCFYDVRSNVPMAVAFAGMLFKLCAGFSLCAQPARDCCYYIIGWDINTLPAWKNSLFCGTMALFALLLGLFIPTLNTVFGLLGSFCGGFLGFCLPALYRMYCGNWGRKQVGLANFLCTYALLVAGVVSIVFGTVASIHGLLEYVN